LAGAQAPVEKPGGSIDLPTSKQIVGVVPGKPQLLGSSAASIAVSPDGRWVVTVNNGYGSYESGYMQSLSVLDTRTGKLVESPDGRTLPQSGQVLFSGLAFSEDGKTLYGSIVSASDPEGKKSGDTGSGIQVYGFDEGKLTRQRVIRIPLQPLAAGRTTMLVGGKPGTMGLPYPAAIAVIPTGCSKAHPCEDVPVDPILVADNLSDDVLLMDARSGQIFKRFDLSETNAVPSTYPAMLAVTKDGKRAFVGLWNASEVVELDLFKGTVERKLDLLKPRDPVAPGSHPSALAMAPDGRTMYVSLANRDAVAAVDLSEGKFALKGFFDARLPHQTFYGAEPESLAVNADGTRLYCANMGSDAVAVMDTRKLTKAAVAKGMVEPIGFIPTEWLPMGVAFTGGKVYIATGKGTGTGPNNFPQKTTKETAGNRRFASPTTYIATLLHGSLAAVDAGAAEENLKALTEETMVDNRMKAAEEKIPWAASVVREADSSAALRNGNQGEGGSDKGDGGRGSAQWPGPIKHVIYIIKENRTYDQILGDLKQDGKPVGNGDASLAMYGAEVTPNEHKLALQFGVLDNFYDSAEVSGDGHVWSNTAIGTSYLERTWQLSYRGRERGYDYEGVVSQGIPLAQNIPDVNEPGSGYIWGNLASHGKTLYHFGEYISTVFCTDRKGGGGQADPQQGPMLEGKPCANRNEVKPGEALPAVWGGGVNKWPWAIPLIASNTATKPELVGHFAPEAPDFELLIPDQIREDVFERHLAGWIADKQAGKDTMPNFIQLRLANDHTAGTRPGGPTPKASVADNDLAVGRAVEAISHSPFWDDTAFFILEDDAQNGADHVDAHRSIALVVSKYSPHGANGGAFIDSRFYSTVSMVRTMETLLGLPPMNNNDALCSLISTLFTGPGDQPAYAADYTNRDNGLIYTANKASAPGARQSMMMDFRHADRVPAEKLNVILWQDAMGDKPVPAMLLEKRKKAKKDDDD
jgi:DNA-binding beta-propeller fold protein YncE